MPRVLLIEDNEQVGALLGLFLEREGFAVTRAANGREGLDLFRGQGADLVITDIVMPEKDGLETILELRRRQPAVKIIAISGGGRIGGEVYVESARRLGAARTFVKPVDRVDLIQAVRELLEGR